MELTQIIGLSTSSNVPVIPYLGQYLKDFHIERFHYAQRPVRKAPN